jgi:pyruvate formate lyase activating enzyme
MLEGKLFDIQHFAVHDGPGIRTLVFFKGCPLRCSWCCNPESHSPIEQLRYVDFKCKTCFNCVKACPYQRATALPDSVKFDFPLCLNCADKPCIDACNHGALTLTGFNISSGKLAGIIAKDIAFYRNSGGGVTFTGGEPLLQPDFLAETLTECKKLDIHTAIETCGYAARSDFERILPVTDLFLFDIKIINDQKHQHFTGISNKLILGNLEFLTRQKNHIILRFPLIPGITDTDENLSDIISLMKRLGLNEIDPEPYHSLGNAKYDELGIHNPLSGILGDFGYPAERLKQIENIFNEKFGFIPQKEQKEK